MDKLRQFLANNGTNGIPNQRLVNNNDDDEEEDDMDNGDMNGGAPQASSATRFPYPLGPPPQSPTAQATTPPPALTSPRLIIDHIQRNIILKRILAVVLVLAVIGLLILFVLLLSGSDSSDLNTKAFISKSQVHYVHESDRAREVKRMVKQAWEAYRKVAWGQEALAPVSNEASFVGSGSGKGPGGSGATILAGASTLYVMGLMDEFQQAREWIRTELDFSKLDVSLNVAEVTTDMIGGLLSCYALSGDSMFRERAEQIATLFEMAYNQHTGLSYRRFNPKRAKADGKWAWLTEAGGQQLELKYLSDLTQNIHLHVRHYRIQEFFKRIQPIQGLYLEELNIERGKWDTKEGTKKSSLGYAGRQFFTGLIKAYVQSNREDRDAMRLYTTALDAMDSAGMFAISDAGLMYARYGEIWLYHSEMMENYACYLGAMLGLGVQQMRADVRDIESARNATKDAAQLEDLSKKEKTIQDRIARHWTLATELTETCHLAANKTSTGLPPYKFHFSYGQNATNFMREERYQVENNLNPELAESYFILWRLTHNPKYQEYAWQLAQAIERNCRTQRGGYSQIENVNQLPAPQTLNYQPPYLLGATLKYIYLTLVNDDGLLPLEEWVFNSAGQPLPIYRNNTAYPTGGFGSTSRVTSPSAN